MTNKSNHSPQKQNTNQSSKILSNQCDAKSSSKNVDIKMTVTITNTVTLTRPPLVKTTIIHATVTTLVKNISANDQDCAKKCLILESTLGIITSGAGYLIDWLAVDLLG